MSKNCRRSSRSCTSAWASCVLLVHRVAIVRPSCVHPVGSCGHRLYFAWPSAIPGIFSTRWQYDGHTVLADGLGKATRRSEAFASNERGHIVFVLSVCLSVCLSFVNFNFHYNFWTIRDRYFIFGMHTLLMTTSQLTPSSMTLWPWLWL